MHHFNCLACSKPEIRTPTLKLVENNSSITSLKYSVYVSDEHNVISQNCNFLSCSKTVISIPYSEF